MDRVGLLRYIVRSMIKCRSEITYIEITFIHIALHESLREDISTDGTKWQIQSGALP